VCCHTFLEILELVATAVIVGMLPESTPTLPLTERLKGAGTIYH